ncbi:MAG: hypothetical protein ABFD89_09155 [Bryobacteraceae bacterium]
MTIKRRLEALAAVNAGAEWQGKVGGHRVSLTKHRRGWVEVWITRRNGGVTFRADDVTDAMRRLEAGA